MENFTVSGHGEQGENHTTLTRSLSIFNGNVSVANNSVANLESSLVDELKLSFQLLIALLGIVGNVLVFVVIRGLKHKKSTTDVYVQNLAIADLGILLLAFPLVAIRERMPFSWPFGEFACLYLYPIPDMFQGASVWCIAVIAIDRYRKILTPRKHSQNRRRILLKRSKIVATFVWVISFLIFSLPLHFVVEYRELPNQGKWCGPVWPSWDSAWVLARTYMGLLTIFSYIVPLVVISWTYLAISRTIHRSNTIIKALKRGVANDGKDCCSRTIKNVRLRQNKRAKKILTPIVLVFAVTMLPLNTLRLTIAAWTTIATQDYYEHLLYVISVFAMLNSSANPVIYSIASKNFRRGIKSLYSHHKSPTKRFV